MKILKVKFTVETPKLGSSVSIIRTFEFDDETSENEIETEITSAFCDWKSDVCFGDWKIIKEETKNE